MLPTWKETSIIEQTLDFRLQNSHFLSLEIQSRRELTRARTREARSDESVNSRTRALRDKRLSYVSLLKYSLAADLSFEHRAG